MNDLKSRTALITGASSGLGARFTRILAARGTKVVLAARRRDRLDDLATQIRADGGEALAVEMDVVDEASVIAAFDEAELAFGTIDTIIANAGMNIEGPAVEVDVAALDQVMAVNVRGVFLTVREGARRLIAAGSKNQGHGRIVIVSSITALSVSPGLSLYSASKAAVLQMGKVLARDWAQKGINVNILCPGYIETDLNSDWFGTEHGERQIMKWPRRRLMQANALDGMLLYLASDDSRFVTGSVISVDDGQTL